MENKEMVVPLPRRMAKYTVVRYRDMPAPDGTLYKAKIEVGISCPHDAVLETVVTRLSLSTVAQHPENAVALTTRAGRTCNLEAPA